MEPLIAGTIEKVTTGYVVESAKNAAAKAARDWGDAQQEGSRLEQGILKSMQSLSKHLKVIAEVKAHVKGQIEQNRYLAKRLNYLREAEMEAAAAASAANEQLRSVNRKAELMRRKADEMEKHILLQQQDAARADQDVRLAEQEVLRQQSRSHQVQELWRSQGRAVATPKQTPPPVISQHDVWTSRVWSNSSSIYSRVSVADARSVGYNPEAATAAGLATTPRKAAHRPEPRRHLDQIGQKRPHTAIQGRYKSVLGAITSSPGAVKLSPQAEPALRGRYGLGVEPPKQTSTNNTGRMYSRQGGGSRRTRARRSDASSSVESAASSQSTSEMALFVG